MPRACFLPLLTCVFVFLPLPASAATPEEKAATLAVESWFDAMQERSADGVLAVLHPAYLAAQAAKLNVAIDAYREEWRFEFEQTMLDAGKLRELKITAWTKLEVAGLRADIRYTQRRGGHSEDVERALYCYLDGDAWRISHEPLPELAAAGERAALSAEERTRIERAESAVPSQLRRLMRLQATFALQGARDADNDGIGEYAAFRDMAVEYGDTLPPLSGQMLVSDGYVYTAVIPDDTNAAESTMYIVAWPETRGQTGLSLFVIDGSCRLYVSANARQPWSGMEAATRLGPSVLLFTPDKPGELRPEFTPWKAK